ncbi:response regulator [Magnetospirillum sp. 15-1]|uniref:response regulator n=1 Tax=Magnetospirillum sp. 15-1 TaxID=1979370 RepID=UPI0024139D17|nr:response regulator [Magnetospirillum sp. 15-1]
MTEASEQQFKVMLVEDDPGDAGLVKAAFASSRFACRIEHIPDGVEAMKRLRALAIEGATALPDLILLDLNMPRKSGHEVLTEMKADDDLKDLPVVVLTTSDAERDVAAAYHSGASGFVTKPVDVDALFESIQGILEYWFGLMRLPANRP